MTNNPKFTLQELTDFLNLEKVSFELIQNTVKIASDKFILSSTRNKVEKGLYFINDDPDFEIATIYNSLILVSSKPQKPSSNIIIVVDNPQLIHYKLALSRTKLLEPIIHPSAIIDPDAVISPSAHIGPYCIIGKCIIGENVALLNNVTVNDNSEIKKNTVIESYTVIGARGMAWIWDDEGNRIMQPQNGGVIIDENCIIGTGIAIVRGSLSENTIVGKGTVMAHGTKIGHGCIIGEQTHFANNVSLAGNANIGNRVFLGSGCVISSNVAVGEGCIIGAGAVVNKTINETYCTIAGVPAIIIKRNNFESKPKGAPKPFKKNKK